uniref:Pyrin domain-containing protein n=1 Tax=Oncorhynchus tshawytscha TaxID=74940 RepID=A0A8C8IX14_ONCTS
MNIVVFHCLDVSRSYNAWIATPERLLATLEELVTDELKMFQWFLNQDVLEGFSSIPSSRLENADRQDTMDKMVDTYGPEGAVKISLEILRRMEQNNLAEQLKAGYKINSAKKEMSSHCQLLYFQQT